MYFDLDFTYALNPTIPIPYLWLPTYLLGFSYCEILVIGVP